MHPQLGPLCGAALPGAFLWQKKKNYDIQMIFHQNGPNLLLTRETTIKTGILSKYSPIDGAAALRSGKLDAYLRAPPVVTKRRVL